MKTVLVGADPFPPYQYLDADGAVQGEDFERVRDAFAQVGYAIEVRLDDWPNVEAALRRGELDAAFQVQRTPQREAAYFFSDLLRQAATEVVSAQPDLALTSTAQIAAQSLSVGVINNYAYGQAIDSLDAARKRGYADQAALLRAISQGEVDIGVFDQGVKAFLAQQLGIGNLHVIDALTFQRPLYVVFAAEGLRNAFNVGMKLMQPAADSVATDPQ